MFFGTVVKPGSTVKLNPEDGEVLHISGACLSNPTTDERTYLILNQNEKNYVVCVLKKDTIENVSLDLFVRTQPTGHLKVQGKGEVHVLGYYEPAGDDSDDDDADTIASDEELMTNEDQDGSTNVSETEEKPVVKGKLTSKENKLGKKSQVKPVEFDDEDDDNDDDEDDDNDDDDDEDDDDDDDDDNDDEQLRQAFKKMSQKKNEKKKQKSAAATTATTMSFAGGDSNKKRKAPGESASGKPEKQQKAGQGGAVVQQFEKTVTDYLKKHGRSLISQVASSCPKPLAITSKYREFLVSRPSFQVEGQHISLKI